MDFLDPRKKRSRQARLMVGYFLLAVAIGLGTVLIGYGVYGYGFDTKTGGIIQNSLLFLGSKPGGADIYINGANQHSTTSARLTLPAGNYQITLKKDGYREWQRNVQLNESSVERFVYPFLFPTTPVVKTIKTYPAMPALITQSPDRRWVLVQSSAEAKSPVSFDLYDTKDLTKTPQHLTIPEKLVTKADQKGSLLTEVEWSTDNTHLLLRHKYAGGFEFLILNRQKPDQSANINTLFKTKPTEVALRNKKIDQLYLFNATSGEIQIGDLTTGQVGAPVLKKVLAFKSYGSSLMTYVTADAMPTGLVSARIWNNGKTYELYNFPVGKKYLIDAAQFQGHWYYVAGSDQTDRINLYKDPLDNIRNSSIGKAIPTLSLSELHASKVSFSINTRFIEVEAGQSFAVYDLETLNYFHYKLNVPISDVMHWMDGHRLIGSSQDSVLVIDYDDLNQQLLTPTILAQGGVFDGSYEHLLTFSTLAGSKHVSFQNVDMRAGVDLPKQ